MLLVAMQDRFRVAACAERMPLPGKLRHQLGIVVDLAVEHNDGGFIFIEDRLLPAAQINDAQTAMAQADIPIEKISVVIRATMRQRSRHAPQDAFADMIISVEVHNAAY